MVDVIAEDTTTGVPTDDQSSQDSYADMLNDNNANLKVNFHTLEYDVPNEADFDVRIYIALMVEMTTSSANNSVFKGFFEKQKLTRPNFIDWYRQLRIVLSIEDKLNYLEQPLPPAPVAPTVQQVAPEILAAHTAWVKGSKEIAGLMLMTMEPEIQ
ncbi:hypothetical protein Tco_1546593 [Tanacetum coccineum]